MTEKQRVINHVTNELHDDITLVYEHLMDDEDEQGLEVLKGIKKKVKELEDNITRNDKI